MAPMNPTKETGREGGWGVDKAVDCRIQIHHLAPRIADSCAPASPGVGKALESAGESIRARRGDRGTMQNTLHRIAHAFTVLKIVSDHARSKS